MSGKNLSFLSKKSWHTGTIRHMDKVWKAEQKHENEQKKIKELQRELERERSRQDLLDAKNGGSSNKGKESLEWMYRGVLSSAKTAEQELNKPYIAPDEKEDLTTPSLLQRKPVSATQDDWNKVMEDPLLNIKQQEQDAIKMIAKNPVKMNEIMKKLKEIESKKRSRSKSKKHKHKHKSHRLSHSPSASPPRKRRRNRSPSPRRINEHYAGEREYRDSRSDRRRNDHHSRDHRVRSPHKYDHRHRSSRRDDRREHRRSRSPRRNDSPPSRRRVESPPYQKRTQESSRYSRSEKDEVARPRRRDRGSRTSGMTEEEKMARVREMEDAGKANYDMKLKRYLKSKQEKETDEEELVSRNEDENFITEMKQGVYMNEDSTIEERLGRHRHYLKKDLD